MPLFIKNNFLIKLFPFGKTILLISSMVASLPVLTKREMYMILISSCGYKVDKSGLSQCFIIMLPKNINGLILLCMEPNL